jgi:hypothetical protein
MKEVTFMTIQSNQSREEIRITGYPLPQTWIALKDQMIDNHDQCYFRMANSDSNVSDWCDQTGEASSSWDFCRECVQTLTTPQEDLPRIQEEYLAGTSTTGYNGDPIGTIWIGPVESPPDEDHMVCDMADCDKEGVYPIDSHRYYPPQQHEPKTYPPSEQSSRKDYWIVEDSYKDALAKYEELLKHPSLYSASITKPVISTDHWDSNTEQFIVLWTLS